MSTNTAVVPIAWSQPLGEPVQWDYRLQEILDSIKRGIEEARRGEGQYLTDADLATGDDAE